MEHDYGGLIQGGVGPDAWDREFKVSAVDIVDAANQLKAIADDMGDGAHVASVDIYRDIPSQPPETEADPWEDFQKYWESDEAMKSLTSTVPWEYAGQRWMKMAMSHAYCVGFNRRGSLNHEPQNKHDAILVWLAHGRVGASSKTMAMIALGVSLKHINHPHDPDDINRCLLLLEAAPEVRNAFQKIASASDTWRRLIEHWDDIEQLFLEEAGLDWSKIREAPRTFKLMKEVIHGSQP